MIRVYEVGGCVRDQLLGISTKDVDYTVEAPSFDAMRTWLESQEFKIFEDRPQYLTIRAKFPKGSDWFANRYIKGLTADFVMARKEGQYTDGRRPDVVEPGTLEDDLARRDFTVNAMAKAEDGTIIDPFNGRRDLDNKELRAVGEVEDRFREDALRALRAIRFAVTKGFTFTRSVDDALRSDWLPGLLSSVSVERRREELLKAFKADTRETLWLLSEYPELQEAIFADGLWLKPSLES